MPIGEKCPPTSLVEATLGLIPNPWQSTDGGDFQTCFGSGNEAGKLAVHVQTGRLRSALWAGPLGEAVWRGPRGNRVGPLPETCYNLPQEIPQNTVNEGLSG